ncbi:LysR family transcriptional regulator [Klebsiella quasipneumoniae]|uniref:LysR family transcriptional regulator n=1 Tax=Klebsiella quasipneumoniae TaxID=1463165 RepID=UPI0011C78CC4|nr:LysR family transcriptional regulator [Klebsiella quasipneumoniae]
MARRFDYLSDVEVFLAVAERGSFTAGAVALSSTPSVLSRAVTRLETRLGCQLLRRSTRRISLTEAGNAYLIQVRQAFAVLDNAEREAQGQKGSLSGRVKLSVPTTWGHYRLPPRLALFRQLHPDVQIELNMTNRNVDIIAEGFDLVVRQGHLPDSGLVAKKLEDAGLCLVASPAYLRSTTQPLNKISDLRHHSCLTFILPATGKVAEWVFRENDQDINWLPPSSLHVSDDVLGVVSLALAGAGICQSYAFIVQEAVARGELVPVLPAFAGRSRPFSVVYPPHKSQSAAARALIALLTLPAEALATLSATSSDTNG